MFTIPANTTHYMPRHAARPYEPRHAAPGVFLRLLGRAQAAARWIAWKSDQPMSGGAMALCGAVLGLITAPLILYCYFG